MYRVLQIVRLRDFIPVRMLMAAVGEQSLSFVKNAQFHGLKVYFRDSSEPL